jgi:hypothetical protein
MQVESFGVPGMARGGLEESLDAEFFHRGQESSTRFRLQEELSDRPENSIFPSNKLVTY